jgi:hypothetical protein
VRARVLVGGLASEAEELWYDLRRRPSFVDGMKAVARVDGDWPRAGSRLVWDSHPGGRGRVVEHVTSHEARTGQEADVEDERMRGTQRVSFRPREGGVEVTLELRYELKEERMRPAPVDVLFVRRPQRESLQRTLRRFATELAAERDPGV